MKTKYIATAIIAIALVASCKNDAKTTEKEGHMQFIFTPKQIVLLPMENLQEAIGILRHNHTEHGELKEDITKEISETLKLIQKEMVQKSFLLMNGVSVVEMKRKIFSEKQLLFTKELMILHHNLAEQLENV